MDLLRLIFAMIILIIILIAAIDYISPTKIVVNQGGYISPTFSSPQGHPKVITIVDNPLECFPTASLIANLTCNNITKIYKIPGNENIEELITQLLGYNASQISPSVYWESAALGGVWGNSSYFDNVSYTLHTFNFSTSNGTESTEYDTIIKLYNVSDYYTTYPPSDNVTLYITSSVINSSVNYAYLEAHVNSYKTKLVSNYTESGCYTMYCGCGCEATVYWTKTFYIYSFCANITFTVYYDGIDTNYTITSIISGSYTCVYTHVTIVKKDGHRGCYSYTYVEPDVKLVKYPYTHKVPGGNYTFYPGSRLTFDSSVSCTPYYFYLYEYEYNVKFGLQITVYNGTCPYTSVHISISWSNGSVKQFSKVYDQRQIKINETFDEWSVNPAVANICVVTYDHILFWTCNITREWHAVSGSINSCQNVSIKCNYCAEYVNLTLEVENNTVIPKQPYWVFHHVKMSEIYSHNYAAQLYEYIVYYSLSNILSNISRKFPYNITEYHILASEIALDMSINNKYNYSSSCIPILEALVNKQGNITLINDQVFALDSFVTYVNITWGTAFWYREYPAHFYAYICVNNVTINGTEAYPYVKTNSSNVVIISDIVAQLSPFEVPYFYLPNGTKIDTFNPQYCNTTLILEKGWRWGPCIIEFQECTTVVSVKGYSYA